MSLTTIVAQNLRAMRGQRKLSQQSVASKAGLSVSYVSMLERGERTPPLETLEAVAKALSVSPLDLLRPRAVKAAPSTPRAAARGKGRKPARR